MKDYLKPNEKRQIIKSVVEELSKQNTVDWKDINKTIDDVIRFGFGLDPELGYMVYDEVKDQLKTKGIKIIERTIQPYKSLYNTQ